MSVVVNLTRGLQYILIPTVILLLWEASLQVGWVPRTLIAGPSEVLYRFIELATNGKIIKHVVVSFERLVIGFIIGSLLGVSLGILVAFRPLASRLLEPTILSLIPIPPIAWIPLLIIFLGIGEGSKIALISIGSFCTLFIQTAYGIRTADQSLVEMARANNKTAIAILSRVLFPSALPGILASMRVALALSWTLLIASEVIASSSGLGWLIWNARNFSRPDDMIVGMVTVGFLGKMSDWTLVKVETTVTRWRRAFRDE